MNTEAWLAMMHERCNSNKVFANHVKDVTGTGVEFYTTTTNVMLLDISAVKKDRNIALALE